ncbi:MAG TPA: thiol:disulfide interchange protein DsbA/DsbL [Dehalococcoidia bacterium]|nr:thiol:disulfide interchange protein DsbA/DsbL [Nevskia sp.]MDI3258637.1 thiol:disulfide interchange protein DsbA/DsbL [Nevskiaceae bacterium]HZU75893.1 thiol:disulfide interchange protein DsbA/DsbL [Dehalococcoidia bacterium]
MRFSLKLGLPLLLGLFAAACHAGAAPAFQLGKDYKRVPQVQTPDDPKKIAVEEFFCYCCPHCFHVDPMIEAWRKRLPADVVFERVPNTLGRPDGEVLARAFYIAQTLNISDKVHKPLFDAIHVQGFPMSSLDSVRDLYVAQAGITPAAFDQASSSFVVDTDLRRADALAQTYRISSVPTLVVGGEYEVSGGRDDLIKVVDFLIDKVREERHLPKP